MRTKNPISISIAPLNGLTGRSYYDLDNTLTIMQRLYETGTVDGFEFQHLEEWDARFPPRAEPQRRAAWETSAHYTTDEIAAVLCASGVPILSVHANRDVGAYLCSTETADVAYGKRLIQEALILTDKVGAEICVFHLWDTWKEQFDPQVLHHTLEEVSIEFPGIKAAIENVPTHLEGCSPVDLLQSFPWITLDLRWAALYNELNDFAHLRDRLANVHLSGQLSVNTWNVAPNWFPDQIATFEFYEAINILRTHWDYTGLLTIEMHGQKGNTWDGLIAAMKTLKENIV